MTQHAKLSPSSADRWMVCPGSVVLSEGMPSKSSKFADEGTLAHALGEACLLDDLPAVAFVGTLFDYEDHGARKAEVIDVTMANHVQTYVDYVLSLGGELHPEQQVKVNDSVYGTADATVWQADTKAMHIVDLKYGAGVPVEIEGNLQLKIYALAALLTFKYPAETVTATIVQPRCPHSDGPVRSATYDVVDLLDFHADLEDAVAKVADAKAFHKEAPNMWGGDYLSPSEKGCRWCPANQIDPSDSSFMPRCPAQKARLKEATKMAFLPVAGYDPAALAKALDLLPLWEGHIKNLREFAYAEAERGHNIPDWKLVEKRATRKWREDPSIVEHQILEATDLTVDDLYDTPSIKSPAVIEKLLPKEKRGLLDELCVKESSGHTLVHASDKRPAIKVDAASAFANS